MSWYADTDYALGFQPNKMISLRNLQVAIPDQITYQDGSVQVVRSDMNRVADGFTILAWIWDTISAERIARLSEFLQGLKSNTVYVRSDIRDGTHSIPSQAFKVFRAVMWKPLLYGDEGSPVAKSAKIYQTVQVKFVDAVVQVGYL
jgi:hypothetical protein